jgi:hypothetical protein
MRRESRPPLKEYYVYKVYFDSITHAEDSDDPYQKVIYYDGGTVNDEIEVIYDGGGVE